MARKLKNAINSIGMEFSHRVEAGGFLGGIWVLWKNKVEVMVECNDFQFFQLKVKFPKLRTAWCLVAFM